MTLFYKARFDPYEHRLGPDRSIIVDWPSTAPEAACAPTLIKGSEIGEQLARTTTTTIAR